ncbi:MAG: hypothetical protein MUF49_09560 [Oculatellaceae cyanobacterium Prado106]|jgi:CheY-specific phosphatase CheX|nr:hypothetical protein [Oculatellaceae cyanobacterium Prado106]
MPEFSKYNLQSDSTQIIETNTGTVIGKSETNITQHFHSTVNGVAGNVEGGMSADILDKTALKFAMGFYDALGAGQ